MGEKEQVECTRMLGVASVLVDAKHITHCGRLRLYWMSFASEVPWPAHTHISRAVLELVPPGGPGPTSRWKRTGVSWPRSSGLVRFATFLRARPQK